MYHIQAVNMWTVVNDNFPNLSLSGSIYIVYRLRKCKKTNKQT